MHKGTRNEFSSCQAWSASKPPTLSALDWPPLTDSSTDGYSEIVDSITQIPGRPNASGLQLG